MVILHPELDDISLYTTARAINPVDGKAVQVIPHKPDSGECIYLGESGCSIHAQRPTICRIFSCVRVFLDTPRAERRRRERFVPGSREIFARGRELAEGAERS